MTVQATAISKWGSTRLPGAPGGDYRFTEVAAKTKEEAIERAERICTRLGGAFAVAWDEAPDERRVRMAETGEEIDWTEFLHRHGVLVGLLEEGETA